MIMVYDGNKVFFLESVDAENMLTTQAFYSLVNNKVMLETIFVECATVPDSKNGMVTVFSIPYGSSAEDKHVLLDYTKVNAVWVRELGKKELDSFDVLAKFVKPIQDKFARLFNEQKSKEDTALNLKFAEHLKVLIAKEKAIEKTNDLEANAELAKEMGNDISFTASPATEMPIVAGGVTDPVAMAHFLNNQPGVPSPAAISESVAVQQMHQVDAAN